MSAGVDSAVFLFAVFVTGVLSGATARSAGFGIGSLLTPLLALHMDTGTAVAAVSIPHAVATPLRCWRLSGLDRLAGLAAIWTRQRRRKPRRRTAVCSAWGAGVHRSARSVADTNRRRRAERVDVESCTQRTRRTAVWTPVRVFWRPSRESRRHARGRAFRVSPGAPRIRCHRDGDRRPRRRRTSARLSLACRNGASSARGSDRIATTGVVIGTIVGEKVLLSPITRPFSGHRVRVDRIAGPWLLAVSFRSGSLSLHHRGE